MEREESFIRLLGYNGKYLISDYGRVYSVDKHGFLPEFEMKDGSIGVHLEWNGRKYAYAVDRLMVTTFFTVPEWAFEEPLVDVKHKDGDLGNNRIDNLYPYYEGDTYWKRYAENESKSKSNAANGKLKSNNDIIAKYDAWFRDRLEKMRTADIAKCALEKQKELAKKS